MKLRLQFNDKCEIIDISNDLIPFLLYITGTIEKMLDAHIEIYSAE